MERKMSSDNDSLMPLPESGELLIESATVKLRISQYTTHIEINSESLKSDGCFETTTLFPKSKREALDFLIHLLGRIIGEQEPSCASYFIGARVKWVDIDGGHQMGRIRRFDLISGILHAEVVDYYHPEKVSVIPVSELSYNPTRAERGEL